MSPLAPAARTGDSAAVARTIRLKVFRTPIGFHDAYVAAPSRKAALAAWGSDADLFARGAAEEVTDPALTAEPLARPGEVIRRSRGTVAEQLAALPPDPPRSTRTRRPPVAATPAPPRPLLPKPDRTAWDEAEAALADADARHRADAAALAEREAELARARQAMIGAQTAENARLQQARDDAKRAYDRALAAWRQS